jgi:hypothetical protein
LLISSGIVRDPTIFPGKQNLKKWRLIVNNSKKIEMESNNFSVDVERGYNK